MYYSFMKTYDFVVIGSGVTGSCIAHFLLQKTDSVLILDKKEKDEINASLSAGGFLSPILGKENHFKSFVNKALEFSCNFYKKNFSEFYDECGVLRLPKDEKDKQKFEEYEKYIDLKYRKKDDGFFLELGGIVNTSKILAHLTKGIKTEFGYEVKTFTIDGKTWSINEEIKAKNIIFATGYEKLLDEEYLQIRGMFGERFDVASNTVLKHNYHKKCSISRSKNGVISIGATHNRDEFCPQDCAYEELLEKAKDIIPFEETEIVGRYGGIRSCSHDYFPLVGKVVNSKETLKLFPHLEKGTYVKPDRFVYYENLYIFNGVGGRGYVESPYLAKILVDNIYEGINIDEQLTPNRLFIKHARRQLK